MKQSQSRMVALFAWVLIAGTALLISACDSGSSSGSGDRYVSETLVYSGTIQVLNVTATAQYGTGTSTSVGGSHIGTVTVTIEPNGMITIQYTDITYDVEFVSSGGVIVPIYYTPELDSVKTVSGTYAFGAFDFTSGNTRWAGSFDASFLSGNATWDIMTAEADGPFRVIGTASFQAGR